MLKYYPFLVLLFSVSYYSSNAQFVYKIKADSVKITNDSCTAELIIENSTKNVQGYLYNKGNGRTEFRRLPAYGDTLGATGNYAGKLLLDTSGADAGLYIYYNNYWHIFSQGEYTLPGIQSISCSGSVAAPLSSEDLVKVDASSGAVALTLPSAAVGKTLIIKKTDSSPNPVTFTIHEGPMSLTTQYTGLAIRYDGTSWMLIQIF